ncbi:MAG: helix-turn-helix transcriptional regulator, partial [Pseudomonadota bacterium]|nr:helix-turn-helix transcriptional regulator [Pseudomonadota bacterium]
MKWVYMNQGVARWSDIGEDDPMGVLESAAGLGLHFGAVASAVSPEGHGKRSYGNFLRADREFTDDELAQLADIVVELHQDGDQKLALTAAEIEALRFQAQGLRLKQIAAELNISMSAVKARLANAKRKLGARTPSQAASIAQTRGLL